MALYALLKAWDTVRFVCAAILLADIFKELAKELVGSRRYVHYIKSSNDLLFAKPTCSSSFSLCSTTFRLGLSYRVLDSSYLLCARLSFKTKKPFWKFGFSVSVCVLFSLFAHFSFQCFKVLFKRHFAWRQWRLKQTFEFSGPHSRVRPANASIDQSQRDIIKRIICQ